MAETDVKAAPSEARPIEKHALAHRSGGVAVTCCHTVVDPAKPAVLIALPFGVPVEVAGPAFDALGHAYNVITWESRYILDADLEFSGGEALSPDDHVDDAIGLLDRLQIQRCRLVGYCSGSGIAVLAAARYPDRFSDLLLVSGEYQLFLRGHASTAYERSIDSFMPMAAGCRQDAMSLFSTMADVANASRAQGGPSELETQMNSPFKSGERLFRYARNYLAYRDFDALPLASRIAHPTLVVMGARDEHTDMENSQAIAAAIGGSSTIVDPDGDHYSFCRRGSRTLAAVVEHLAPRAAHLGPSAGRPSPRS